ncbi:hypothetical protein H4R26_004692 [Coemansia thaxteri]|uniref:Uncharacterized protein n=1 Tax=Coemansia thaxteri TaxID=2663907 RepID=A0A9W8EHB7_9FUNG|nr:hypothetical protein H4R26_004692 [Coemansia thaxteri]
MGTGTRQPAGQHRSTMGASSVPPPLPQQPLDPRVPTPGYAQYQNYQYYQPPQQQQQQQEPVHCYGQALYVDPNSPQSVQSSYVSPPLTTNAPDGVYQQQQSKYYSAQPLSATQARNQQQQHQQNVYGGSQHSGVSPGSATTATGPSNGYYQV